MFLTKNSVQYFDIENYYILSKIIQNLKLSDDAVSTKSSCFPKKKNYKKTTNSRSLFNDLFNDTQKNNYLKQNVIHNRKRYFGGTKYNTICTE